MNKIIGTVDGQKKEFEVILTHHSSKFNKDYLVYTDNTKNEDNKLKVYISSYDKEDTNPNLNNNLTPDEINEVTAILNCLE